MANYQQLKNALVDVIKQNGNNEITGEIMQTTLLSMINSLGANYQFAGILTPSTSFVAPDENVFLIGGGGTYNNFGASQIVVPNCSIGIFMYNGTYSYQIIQSDSVFDISVYHATGDTLAQYADLVAALGTYGVNVPYSIRKGGMSIKFIQSSDNKYKQFRYMLQYENTTAGNAAFVNIDNWQGVDEEPISYSKNLVESGGVYHGINQLDRQINGSQSFQQAVIGTTGAIKFNTISLAQDGDSIEFKTLRDESATMGRAFLTLDDKMAVIVNDGIISILLDNNNWQTNFNMSNGTAVVEPTYSGVRTFKLAVESGNIKLYQDGVLKASATLENTISFNTLCYRAVDRWDASTFYYWEGTLLAFKYTHAGVTYEPQELAGFTTSGDVTITYTQNGGIVGDISDLDERVENLEEDAQTEYTVAEEKIIPYTDNSGYVSSDTGEIVTASNAHTAIIDVSSGDVVYIRAYQTEFWLNYGYGFVLSDNSWVGVHTTQNKDVVIPVPENAVTFKMAWNTNAISAVQEYFYLGKKVKIEDEFKKKKTTFQFLPDFDLSRVPNVSFIQQTNDINDIYGRYDALISEYSSYVTKVDCSDADSVLGITRPSYLNNIPIYMYCFKPTPNNAASNTNYIKRPSVLILTGTHAGEKLSIYTTYSLMKMVCENWKNDINAEVLRTMADIYVIPLVNPWGFINCVNPPVDNPYAGRTNGNGVNLNRNFPTLDWHSTHNIASGDYEGSSAGSEYETKIVCYYASQIKPDVFFDWHTGNMNANGDMGTIESIKNKAADSVCLAVSKSMSSRLIKDNGYDGNIGDFPNNPDTILISYGTYNTPPITGSTYIWGFENVSKLSILTEQCTETKWKDGVLTDTVQSQNTDVIYRENLQFSYDILLRALYAASQIV